MAPSAFAQDRFVPDPEEIIEARAITEIAFPVSEREATFDMLVEQIISQFQQAFEVPDDPGLKSIFQNYLSDVPDRLRPVLQDHLPKMFEAQAIAYSRNFTLEELREIRTFAETDTGRRLFQSTKDIMGDPALAAVNSEYFKKVLELSTAMRGELQQQIREYLTENPEILYRLAEETKE